MPKAGITVESCIIGTWEKKVGDPVKIGDVLFTYETDKASFECESTAEGVLLDIFYGEGYIALDACTAHTGKVNCLVIDDNFTI